MATEDHSNSRNRVIEDCLTTRQPPALDASRLNPDVSPPEISGPKDILAVPVFSSTHSTTSPTFTQESHSDQLHISSTSLSTSSVASSMSSVPTVSNSSSTSSLQLASSSTSNPTSTAFVTEPALQSILPPRLGSGFDSGLSKEKTVCPISTTNDAKPAHEPIISTISTITSLNLLPGTSHLNTTTASDGEPLNLSTSKSQKQEEKVISSSLFGVIPKTCLVDTKTGSSVVKLPAAVGKSAPISPYKITHPIGSRKVTENVITYHEPMFQSVANTLFENQKNLMMGKRKVEEEKSKGDSFSPETKKKKLDNSGFVSKTEESKPVVKKKCSIENIIEKIRTKKTLSRGGSNSQLNEMNEQVNDLNTVKSDQINESQSSENENGVEKSSLSEVIANKLLEKSQSSLGNLVSISDDSIKETCVASVNKNSENVEKLGVNAQNTQSEFSQSNKNDSRIQEEPVTGISETDPKDKTKAESPTKKDKASPKLKKSENESPKQKKSDSISPKEWKSDKGLTKQKKTENVSPKSKKIENFVPKPEKLENKYPKQKKNAELTSKKNKPENISTKKLKTENESHSQNQEEKKSPKSKETEKMVTKSAIQIKSENTTKNSEFSYTPSDEVIKQTDAQISVKPKNKENSEKCEINGDGDNVSSGVKIEDSSKEQVSGNVKGMVKEESNIKKVKKKLLDSCKSEVFEKNEKTLIKKKKIDSHDGEKLTAIKKKKVDSDNGKSVKMKEKKLTKVDSNETPKKRGRKKKSEVTDDESIKTPKKKADGAIEKKKQNTIKKKLESKTKITKARKPKLSIANRRVKREASLNAATFLHILNEKSPRTQKLNTQRSKSDSDIKNTQLSGLYSSHSMIDIGHVADDIVGVDVTAAKECKSPKKEKLSLAKGFNGPESDRTSPKVLLSPKIEPLSPSKTVSPYRKVSFSEDDAYESVFTAVIQRSIEATEKFKTPTKLKEQKELKFPKTCKEIDIKSKLKDGIKKNKKRFLKLKPVKDKKFELKKLKKTVQITVSKSPEETAEKKRKANLARLERAKEIRKTERKVSEKMSAEEKESDDSVSVGSVSHESDIDEATDTEENESNEVDDKCDEIKKVKAKKGALCRAARTHISVESKTVVENTMPSPRWCECCQSNYYPSQPNPGAQVWRIKHLVDKDSSKSPEPIQSSSNHFIAAHASCEIRPYSSPSHMSVLDSNPFVGQIMSHSHIQCSACSCGHSGVYHPGQCQQCQNCTLGSVSNMLPCQRYGSTYSVTYPHSHGSYTHCGCGACYPAGNYHHPVGQTLIHQPQMTMSAESSILLHRPVQLQVTHEASHPTHTVTMPTMPHSHSDSSLAHSVQPMTLQLSRSEQNRNSLTYMCQLSQGELTNVSLMGSNSPADHEIDVGSRDDVLKSVPNANHLSSHSSSSKCANKNSKIEKTKTKVSTKTPIKVKRSHSSESPSTKSDSVSKKKRVKSTGDQLESNKKSKTAENVDSKSLVKIKEKKKSNLLLIKQKQKQLEEKSAKLLKQQEYQESQKKFITSIKDKKLVKDKLKQSDSKTSKKDKERKNSKGASKKEETWELEQPKVAWHGWSWDGEGVVKKVTNIFDGQTVERKCYNGIRHEDGDVIKIKDCVLVCSGQKEKDIPYVAKISNFWEDSANGEMMMSVLWFYRPEHAEGCQIYGSLENEVFAAKHRDETLVACIEDRGYVLTYNEYCRFMAEVERTKSNLPQRKKVVPDPEEAYPSNRIPPVDVNPENVFLCRQVYDIKLKRVLKNPA